MHWSTLMRPAADLPEVYLSRTAIDFRKGLDALAQLVEAELGQSPFSERLLVFVNRRRDKIKILYWERNGFSLWQKRGEEERVDWPHHLGDALSWTLTGQQLNWLLDGYDLARMRPHRRLDYAKTC
jgi:transposase